MDFEKYLHNGIKMLKKGDYLDAINNFEEYLSNDNTNYYCYYYLGLAYIFRELYDEAHKFILKAYNLNDLDPNIINAMAFINLKYNNVQEAINYWLDILDIDKKNYLAKRNLDKVRKTKNVNSLVANASADDFISFKVRPGLNISWPKVSLPKIKRNYLIVTLFVLVSIAFFLFIKKYTGNSDSRVNKVIGVDLDNVHLPDVASDYVLDKNITKSMIRLEPDTIQPMFYDTKVYIQDKKFNLATVNINKVLHSNVSVIIKEKFRILSQFIVPLETFSLKDNVPYSELMNLPLIYEGVQVVWEGKLEDLDYDEDHLGFNLIVKEENKSIGMAKVVFKKTTHNLNNGMNVVLSGKFIKIDEDNRYPLIEGLGLKRTGN